MCFGSKDKSDDPAPKPVQAPPQPSSSSKPTASMPEQYAPPPGPPPTYGQNAGYAPPPGPPPSHQARDSGPLPAKNNPFFSDPSSSSSPQQQQTTTDDYAPPPGPPPGPSKPPQHDWQSAVPDTALLPPPPDFFGGFDRSPAHNATEAECDAGERWCAAHPPYAAQPRDPAVDAAARRGDVALYVPPGSAGFAVARRAPGVWRVEAPRGAPDTCLATYPPLYHAAAHSPAVTGGNGGSYTAYYEVRIREARGADVGLALGFVAPPYPGFRLPGWHRASVGVHGDDGHRYVNDRWGGKAFAAPFRAGETVGLGMEFSSSASAPPYSSSSDNAGGSGIKVRIFLTRDGREAGSWDLHEETDRAQDLPVTGLEGRNDLCAAVGVFGGLAVDVVFAPDRWAWRG
ncbi:hypothetical protein GGR52DRAFT_592578 [Hypoxylon sp. FL1284]|nr:hypothetical protein GGR52DRAFT_592578 [Hypoxylon sp. FL1284]